MASQNQFQFTRLNEMIEVHLPDGRVLSGPRGSTIGAFLKKLQPERNDLIVGAVVNNQLRELSYTLDMDARVRPVCTDQADGMRFYRRSLTFLLETAFMELFHNANLAIDHSISSGGYFCQTFNRASLSDEDLTALEKRMHKLVDQDIPFKRERVSLDEAITYFKQVGHTDKVRLLEHRQKDYLELYSLGQRRDYHHGYLVPSTGYLKWFKISAMGDGFVLRFPRRHKPTEILPIPDTSNMLVTFRQYGDWLQRLGIDNVGMLNNKILHKRVREVILISEALHEQRIASIAAQIANNINHLRVVLIAGPSSSGKTTFSKRLAIQLLAMGISPFPLEMDRYFVNRNQTPLDENGDYNFETIKAVDTQILGENIKNLIAGNEVQLPHFDFKSGLSSPGDIIRLLPGQIIILEGIHGLNPELLPTIPANQTFRIYTSALTQLNLDAHNRVSTTDTRLIRRIVRDARERGYSAQDTIRRWESVRRGEKRYIFPHQGNSDSIFNSALVYELSALKELVEPLIRQVPFGTPEHIEAKRLLSLLEWFRPLNVDLIPDNSLLREFMGHSILHNFKIWQS